MTNLAAQIEGDFIAMLDEWHSLPETWDEELDSQIHSWYVDPPKVWPKRPYFSPSSLGSCPRELYVKATGAKRDVGVRQPHQARWANLGTAVGDMIQRDLLFIEKHFEAKTGNAPRFKFLRDPQGRPRFEEFAKANVLIKHNGEEFYLYGAPDGIMQYVTDDGEILRVGLEIKSKSTTPARTSKFSMREPDASHLVQTQAYATMYGCDYYIILYVNVAKKSWNMSEEDYDKTPDIRAFCIDSDDIDRTVLFSKPAEVSRAVREGTPPKLDLSEWTFNNYKDACAKSLTDEEYEEIVKEVSRVEHSSLPEWKKRGYTEALEYITEARAK